MQDLAYCSNTYGPTELHNAIARKEVDLNLDYFSHIAHAERHAKEKHLAQIHVVFPESGFDSRSPDSVWCSFHLNVSLTEWSLGMDVFRFPQVILICTRI